jgi:hypothetical protein
VSTFHYNEWSSKKTVHNVPTFGSSHSSKPITHNPNLEKQEHIRTKGFELMFFGSASIPIVSHVMGKKNKGFFCEVCLFPERIQNYNTLSASTSLEVVVNNTFFQMNLLFQTENSTKLTENLFCVLS